MGAFWAGLSWGGSAVIVTAIICLTVLAYDGKIGRPKQP